MAKKSTISISVIKRLPRYHRYLGDMLKSGTRRISSRELAHIMSLTASQIRQDLNCFGGFGQQGYGYNVEYLYNEISNILGIPNRLPAVLIGAGNLGKAIARQMDFGNTGFQLIGVFDQSPDIVGKEVSGLTVKEMSELDKICKEKQPKVAILCIPKEATPAVADKCIELGIMGFWNFTQYDLAQGYDNIAVENVHLSDSLMTLCYQVNDLMKDGEE